MDDFTAKPGTANMFGLVQGAANAIKPGKRPLSSMSPTIALRDGKIFMVVGSPGGPAHHHHRPRDDQQRGRSRHDDQRGRKCAAHPPPVAP